jgi:hypothetical protein
VKLDLENDGIEMVEMTVDQARNMTPDEWSDHIAEALDNAQAYAFTGEGDAYLVIKIKRAPA